MKRIIKEYFSFSRTERYGIVALLTLLFVLVVARTTMHLWVRPETNTEEEQKLVAAWNSYKQESYTSMQPDEHLNDNEAGITDEEIAKGRESKEKQERKIRKKEQPLVKANLNTVDSATLTRIKGIGPKLAHRIIAHRNKIGKFTSHMQLKDVYHFSDEVYNRMAEALYIE